jgi:hypothetical protein
MALMQHEIRDHDCRLVPDNDEWYLTISTKTTFPERGEGPALPSLDT